MATRSVLQRDDAAVRRNYANRTAAVTSQRISRGAGREDVLKNASSASGASKAENIQKRTTATKSGGNFLQKLADILTFSTNMSTASDMQIYGNDALKTGGERLQTQTEQAVEKAKEEIAYIGERAAVGAANALEGIVNAAGYAGQALSRTQNLQASQDAAMWSAVTGSDTQKAHSEKMESTALQSIRNGLQDTADFGTRYRQNVEKKVR